MRPILWLVHVPRTGGTSMTRFFNKINDQVKFVRFGHDKFSGHVLEQMEKANKRKVYTFTIIRDPVSHTRSLYSFLKQSGSHPKRHTAQKSFTEWIKTFDELPNYFCKFYDHKGQGDLERAKKVLGRMDFVIHTNDLGNGINRILASLGINTRFDGTHVSNFSKPKMSEDQIRLIKNLRANDYELIKDYHSNS